MWTEEIIRKRLRRKFYPKSDRKHYEDSSYKNVVGCKLIKIAYLINNKPFYIGLELLQ